MSSKHAILAVNYGSIDRIFELPGSGKYTQVPDGVAHFLEHRVFERSGRDIAELFTALGAEVNAHTSFTNTAYFFPASTDSIKA
jgi:predicted Zn-dependent peptidase